MKDARLHAELEVFRMSPEELVEHVYRLALRRAPEPEELAGAAARLRDGTLSPAALLSDAVGGEEFRPVRVLDDACAQATWARRRGERPRELEAPAWLDERAIEIPWTLARYRGEPRVLDVGCAFAWLSSFAEAGFECVEHETYERTEDGWRTRPGLAPAGLRYGSRGDGAAAVLYAELRPWTALARVRRALRPR
jgi:hypothetical protein